MFLLILSLVIGINLALLFDIGAQKISVTPAEQSGRSSAWQSRQLVGVLALFGIGLLTAGAIFGSYVLGAPFAALLAGVPTLAAKAKRRRNEAAMTQAWPDAIDHLSSAIRAGLGLAESLTAIGLRGPAPLRPYFVALGNDLSSGTPLASALTRFSLECHDPIADQLVETVLIAHEVGGNEIGRLLRTFSQFLRVDIQTREEIRVRQGWVVNGARIAVAAPWFLLAMLSLRRESVVAFQSTGGFIVIFVGAGLSVLAYLWMSRLGRLGGLAE